MYNAFGISYSWVHRGQSHFLSHAFQLGVTIGFSTTTYTASEDVGIASVQLYFCGMEYWPEMS